MSSLTIKLYDVTPAMLKYRAPSSASSDDSDFEDQNVIPFTRSPLDECRGGSKKSSHKVRDATKKAHAKTRAAHK
jgi:hypothetical protein